MNIKKIGIAIGISILMVGCSGTQGNIRKISAEKRDTIVQNLNSNEDEYNIYQCPGFAIIEPANTDRKIIVIGLSCGSVDQQNRSDFIKKYLTSDFHEIVGPSRKNFGYLAWRYLGGSLPLVLEDEKTMLIDYYPINPDDSLN